MQQYNFSVIIPCYNTAQTLCETVDSVLKQDLGQIQIIIIDDASTDSSTRDKIMQYHGMQGVETIMLKSNGGLAHARNVGLSHVQSPYVLCLDSDDYIDQTYLRKARNLFEKNQRVGVVSPGVQHFGESTKKWMPQATVSLSALLAQNRIPGAASCVRMDVYKDVGKFDTALSIYEDWDFWIRVFGYTNWELDVVPEYLFFYRIRKNSMVHGARIKEIQDAMHVIITKHRELYTKHMEEILVQQHIKNIKHMEKHPFHFRNRIIQMKKKFFPRKLF